MKIIYIYLIIILIIFIIYPNIFDNLRLFFNNNYNTDLVVCVYNENINWINNIINEYNKIYIYSKNNKRLKELNNLFTNKKIKIINLKNIGSCDHVYLYHIIKNYDNLNSNIHFSKGTKFYKIEKYYKNILNSSINIEEIKNFYLENWDFTNNKNTNFKYYKSNFKNLNEYLQSIFSQSFINNLYKNSRYIIYGGNFMVSKKNIQNYSKTIYEKLINYDIPYPNREIDHYHERIWGLLFTNNKL